MKAFLQVPFLIVLLAAVLIFGCVFQGFSGASEKYDMTVELSEDFGPGSQFSARTSNGSITITGSDTPQCSVTATITGRADTVERARTLAEQTKIRLDHNDTELKAVIDSPDMKRPESISVNYQIQLPYQTALDLATSNGKITISQIQKSIQAHTSNGKIRITDTCGAIRANTSNGRIDIKQSQAVSMDLHTSNGAIQCENVTGNITASTSNGSVTVHYVANADPATDIHITTSNGEINLKTPEHYSAKVDAATSNGKIYIDMPITVQGEIGKKIKGMINGGDGQLYLRTSNSSIHVQ